ncbi:MAG TPA: universal stress protein [Phycisphaerae bacterium]|nr:universal stress protein [Phycisphaerae bacterium]
MNRRIIVGLDGTDYAANAVRVGCAAVKTFGGTLVGVAIVDKPGIEASERGAGVGAYQYAREAREHRLKDAREKTRAFLDDFEKTCHAAGINHDLAHHHADPVQALLNEGRFADAILLGTRTHFRFETQEGPGDTLKRAMEVGVCPVVAVPRDAHIPQRAVVAFDGSMQAARALRAYVHFACSAPQSRTIQLLYVHESGKSDDEVQLVRAQQYVAGWGFEVEVLNRQGEPGDVVAQVARECSPCIVVMGAYGRTGLVSRFFGSTAKKLLDAELAPVFVYH